MYLLGTTLRLEGYAAYFLPLPMIIMAQRHCSGAAWRTLLTTATLLGVLFGPLKALNYVLVHGIFGVAMAVGFQRGLPAGARSRHALPLRHPVRHPGPGCVPLQRLLLPAPLPVLGAGTPSPFVIQCAILGLVVFHCN